MPTMTGNQNVYNVGGQVSKEDNPYFEQWSDGRPTNKVVILNTQPPEPQN